GDLPIDSAALPTPAAIQTEIAELLSTATPAAAVPPVTAMPTLSNCPGLPESRMVIGESGRVTPGAANNLREAPSTSARRIGQIPGGGQFTVLEGPRCVEGYAWWRV